MTRLALPVSVTIIALNEEEKLPRAIESVRWADEVLVIDSGSTDRTVEVAERAGATVIRNPWPGYGQQKNFAQSRAKHDWILNIDADESVPPELAQEIARALESVAKGASPARGFALPRKTFYLGRWIRHGGWYPNYLVRLADRRHARWSEPQVHEALVADGEVLNLGQALYHDAFSSIHDQILVNARYARLGAEELRRRGQAPSLVKLVLKPWGKFFETYVLKQGFLDGLAGFIISVNAAHSLFLKYAYLFEERLKK